MSTMPLSLDAIKSQRFRKIVENTFAADQALDAERFVNGLTADGSFRLGGLAPVVGRDAVRVMVAETFTAFTSVVHTLLSVVEGADILAYEAIVNYHFKDGRTAELPYCNVLHFQGDLVQDYRIYLDLTVMGHQAT